MSLADELLADLEAQDEDQGMEEALTEDLKEVGSRDKLKYDPGEVGLSSSSIDLKSNGAALLAPKKEVMDFDDEEDVVAGDVKFQSVRRIAKLRHGSLLARVMADIETFSAKGKKEAIDGLTEIDPEYQLIVEANNLTVEIDNEIGVIHKYTRDHYTKRFPELESLVPSAMEYMKTAKALGNQILEQSKRSEVLSAFLPPATVMVVSVTASTTQGQLLSDEELAAVIEACDMAIELVDFKTKILTYVESRMSFIAPNLSLIVGASVAAKLMGHAGGLSALSRMPACNVLVLGAQRKTLVGFSSATSQSHQGYVWQCELVQRTPPDFRVKAARLVSAKSTLAARVDAYAKDSSFGEQMLAEIDKKMDKIMEPPPVKQIKALPMPIDPPAKKRGGRRYRKMKERLGLTEMRKAANRMTFGHIVEDAYQEDLGLNLGTLGKSTASRLRAPVADAKTKAKVSKALAQKLHRQHQHYGGSTTIRRQIAGTASVAFTPLQGLEIVNPLAVEKKTDEANKYFSNTSGFRSVQKAPP